MTDNRTNEPTEVQVKLAYLAHLKAPRTRGMDVYGPMRAALVAAQGAAPQDPERVMLHHSDGTPKSNDEIRSEAAEMREGSAPQAESDTQVACAVNHAGGVCPGYPHGSPVLPSSTESPVEPFKTWFACWWKNEPNAIAESNAQSAFYAGWDARGLPSSGVDEEKLAEVIRKLRFNDAGCMDDGIDCTESVSDHADDIARAVAGWLKGQGGESRGDR